VREEGAPPDDTDLGDTEVEDTDLALALKLERAAKTAEVAVNGETCWLDLSGALWLPAHRTLVVSDLHLEKGSSYAARGGGQFLPPYDTRETLAQLHEVIVRHDPARVVALGDSFHDAGAPQRMDAGDRGMIDALADGRDWVWITGNHDTALASEGTLPGRFLDRVEVGALNLRHEPRVDATAGEVAGHLHPVGKVAMRGRAVRRRCFVTDGQRMVMPAFGAYAGGLNVRDRAFEPLFAGSFTAHLLGDGRVFAIGKGMLARD
jgi:uncharacterized protein